MTVNYAQQVATERVGGFFRMLYRWRGSIYRAVSGELAIFILLYYVLYIIYLPLKPHQQNKFAEFCKSCEDFADYIPVTFIVGFYVVRAISRRWSQWENMPWPDRCVFNISGNLHGTDLTSRMLRRTIARYVNLGSILCFRDISIPVKKRFPTLEHLINAGLMTPEEQKLYESTSCDTDTNWWIPFHWAFMLVEKAKREDRLDSGQLNTIREDILDLRHKCWVLFSHDWVPVPMVYTQVVTLAVYMFMLACLFGRQSFASFPPVTEDNSTSSALSPLNTAKRHAEYYFPFFTVCQVMFYLGWLKVAEILINPMGEDADDFEVNYIIDRNLRVSYTVVDYSYNKLPPVEKDIHWDAEEPDIPHTAASAKTGTSSFIGSAANVNVPKQRAGITEGVSRQTSAQPVPCSTPTPPAPHSKSDRVLRSISRLLSKDNEILDAVKTPPEVASPPTKAKRGATDIPLQALESGEENSRPPSVQQQQSRLAKISESGEVLVRLLSENENGKRDTQSTFYLSESPPRTAEDETDEDGNRGRLVLPHQQRNVPCTDSPPVIVTKEPPDLL